MKRDPLRFITVGLAALTGGALGVTGEVTAIALLVPLVAVYALLRPAQAPRGRAFEVVFQIVALGFLILVALKILGGAVLAGAAAATLAPQVHALLGEPTHDRLRRLHVLGLVQIVALAASTTRVLFAPLFLAYLILLPLALTLSALERAEGLPRRPLPWKRSLLWNASGAAAACLALGAVGFLALPRYEYGMGRSLAKPPDRMSGFSEQVTLGDITRIQSSDKVVMRVRFEGARPDELRWRGKAFDRFSGREWSVSTQARPLTTDDSGARIGPPTAGVPHVVQDFALEPMQERALFHLGNPLQLAPENFATVLVDRWGNLTRGGGSSRRVRYRVVSETRLSAAEPDQAEHERYLQLPALSEQVAELAVATAGEGSDAERASRMEKALQEGWRYSLDVNDVGVESPVERFLLEKAPGHCEYFATGMVVMLREVGIPARLVTGFQAGTWSRMFGTQVVRQRDAHAWVEAFVEGQGWTTFDPTPFEGREVTDGSDAIEVWRRIEMMWDDNVIGFNYTFQVGFLVTVREQMDRLVAATRSHVATATVAVSSLGAIVTLLVAWRWRRRHGGRARRTSVGFYAAAQRILRRRGWRREPGQTPMELAGLAAREGGSAGQAAMELTRLYYAARYGGHAPDRSEVARLLSALEALPRRA